VNLETLFAGDETDLLIAKNAFDIETEIL